MTKRMAGVKVRDTGGEVWVRISSFKRKYFISRPDNGKVGRIDDEAQLEIGATIEAIVPAYKKHLGATFELSLLSAQDYSPEGSTVSAFFGSLTLRGMQRSALAYLRPAPFWELPAIIASGATWIALGWKSMHRGSASLTSVFLGDETDLEQLATTCVRFVRDVDAAVAETANLQSTAL